MIQREVGGVVVYTWQLFPAISQVPRPLFLGGTDIPVTALFVAYENTTGDVQATLRIACQLGSNFERPWAYLLF